jgi:hypothetical protein
MIYQEINESNKRTALRVIGFIILFLLSSVGMFGQTTNEPKENVILQINNQNDVVSVQSNLDFMGWFMGSNQNQNNIEINNIISTSNSSTKKQIISSGISPNRVLYRTFVKKVMNKDSAIA